MKQGIHPNYVDCTITCACGNVIKTRSTKPEIHVEVCSKCHPFYTGKQKLVDTGGRVERFNKRFGRKELLVFFSAVSFGRQRFFVVMPHNSALSGIYTPFPYFEHFSGLK